MEKRVARLEGQMDVAVKSLVDIKATLAEINAKLDGKPGTWTVLAMNITLVGLILAAIGFGARVL